MKYKKIIIIAVLLIISFTFFNPFGSYDEIVNRKVPLKKVNADLVTTLKTELLNQYQTPSDYVVNSFKNHDIVFLGEFGKVAAQVKFTAGLIPLLYAKGITNIGIEFVLFMDQKKIDEILTSSYYNEKAVHQLFFNYLVIWGFIDYADLFKAVWEFNQTLPKGQPPFRLIGLGVKQYYNFIKSQADVEDPAVLKKVYADGIPDVFTANIIKQEFIAKNQKALIYCHIYTAFTKYSFEEYYKKLAGLGFPGIRNSGKLVYEEIGNRAMTIYMHSPVPSKREYSGFTYPVGGVIDAVLSSLPDDKKKIGFSPADSSAGYLDIGSDIFGPDEKKVMLKDFCDGYIVIAPLQELTVVKIIPDFINETNYEQALYNFYGMQNKKPTIDDMNDYIRNDISSVDKILNLFRR